MSDQYRIFYSISVIGELQEIQLTEITQAKAKLRQAEVGSLNQE
jgi:hypothetical protein